MSLLRSPTKRPAATARSVPLDREYWLAHCEGYHVVSPGGRVGLVERVRLVPGSDAVNTLVVLAGMRGRRRMVIPVSEVEAIVPHNRVICLKPNASISDSDATRRLPSDHEDRGGDW